MSGEPAIKVETEVPHFVEPCHKYVLLIHKHCSAVLLNVSPFNDSIIRAGIEDFARPRMRKHGIRRRVVQKRDSLTIRNFALLT